MELFEHLRENDRYFTDYEIYNEKGKEVNYRVFEFFLEKKEHEKIFLYIPLHHKYKIIHHFQVKENGKITVKKENEYPEWFLQIVEQTIKEINIRDRFIKINER